MKKHGVLVPGYTVIKKIAEGGMSTLLLASHSSKKNNVVLKVIYTKENEDPLILKRFMREYALVSFIKHPNIIRIYERAFASDFAYIAMEYFPEGDLSKRIKEGLKEETSINYLNQMCEGLIALHELNIVHRDIKPGNILFKNDGTLAITDFGVAKDLTNNLEDITIDNQILGTPYYMSPEQATGMPTDHRSDLYSLGIMFYQMLAKERPYTAKSISELISAHLYKPVPKLPNKLKKYQPIIDGLLAKDINDRFQSAHDLMLGIKWVQ